MKISNILEPSNQTQVFTNANDNPYRILINPLGEDFYNFNNDDTELDMNGIPEKKDPAN